MQLSLVGVSCVFPLTVVFLFFYLSNFLINLNFLLTQQTITLSYFLPISLTGEEFFVGISKRTNSQGAMALAKAFPNYSVSSIKITDQLHLKSMMSMAGPGILAIGRSKEAKSALQVRGKGSENTTS